MILPSRHQHVLFTMIIASLFLLWAAWLAWGKDDGRYANSPNKEWFQEQHNQNKIPCCETADGHRLDDADWKSDAQGNYLVKIEGAWYPVPPEAVINPITRPIDYAIVWYQNPIGNLKLHIWCFMAGTGM